MQIEIRNISPGESTECEQILRSLPQWFGIEESIRKYAEDTSTMPTMVALLNESIVGFITIRKINEYSAEINAIAVLPEFHGKGIGTELLKRAEDFIRIGDVEFLTVKTLSPSHPDESYNKTRMFYASRGFRPLEEIEIWGPENPCLIMIKKL